MLVHDVAQGSELLEEQKESLIDVFFIRELLGNHFKDIFYGFGPFTLFPDG
jgi:hypothetical protein